MLATLLSLALHYVEAGSTMRNLIAFHLMLPVFQQYDVNQVSYLAHVVLYTFQQSTESTNNFISYCHIASVSVQSRDCFHGDHHKIWIHASKVQLQDAHDMFFTTMLHAFRSQKSVTHINNSTDEQSIHIHPYVQINTLHALLLIHFSALLLHINSLQNQNLSTDSHK